MKLCVSIGIDKMAVKFEFDEFSMNGFWVIALDLNMSRQNLIVAAVEATILNGFGWNFV